MPAFIARPNVSQSATRIRTIAHNAYVGTESVRGSRLCAPATKLLADRTIAIKDNILTSGGPTSAGSKSLCGFTPPIDATVVRLLREHGAVLGRKTNMDEFGMGSHSRNSASGPVKSHLTPPDASYWLSPGGSSGGSAVAVATGDCWAALGTDTGGSVRLPAAYTGTVGFKPSYGRISRWGVIPYANSLDTVGILAKTVGDIATVFSALDRFDSHDPTSLSESTRQRIQQTNAMNPDRLRIGVPLSWITASLSDTIRQAWIRLLTRLRLTGHMIVPCVDVGMIREALASYYVLAPAEASSNLAKYDGIRYGICSERVDPQSGDERPLFAETRDLGFGAEAKRRILLGSYTLSSEAKDNYFIQAQKVRRLIQRSFDNVFVRPNPLVESKAGMDKGVARKVDVLLAPTAPTLPPTSSELDRQSLVQGYMNDVYTVPASLAGLPAVSVPVPVGREAAHASGVHTTGMQIIGQFGADADVLTAARLVEECCDEYDETHGR